MLGLLLVLSLNSTAYKTSDPVTDKDPNKLVFELKKADFPILILADKTVSSKVAMATLTAAAYWTFHLGFKAFTFESDEEGTFKTSGVNKRRIFITQDCPTCDDEHFGYTTYEGVSIWHKAEERKLERMVIHEFGHVLGLPHVSDLDFDNIMCKTMPGGHKTTVTNTQVNMIRQALGLKPTKFEEQ